MSVIKSKGVQSNQIHVSGNLPSQCNQRVAIATTDNANAHEYEKQVHVNDSSGGISGVNVHAPEFVPNRGVQSRDTGFSEAQFAKCLSKFANISRLPVPEPGMFSGDPLEYPSWKCAFSTLIESRNINPSEKVHYLKRYLSGSAKQCVEGLLLIPTTHAYTDAMALLERRFGGDFAVASAFKGKIEAWPKISSKDYTGLRAFSDFLCQCEVIARTNYSLNALNDDILNRQMCSKLPDWFVGRWAREIHRFREISGRFPPFANFVAFLKRESEIACEPVVAATKIDKPNVGRSLKISGQISKVTCSFCEKSNHD